MTSHYLSPAGGGKEGGGNLVEPRAFQGGWRGESVVTNRVKRRDDRILNASCHVYGDELSFLTLRTFFPFYRKDIYSLIKEFPFVAGSKNHCYFFIFSTLKR